jgi:hypothetical protein
MELALRGLIDVQAGAVTALVEGGSAAGQMSLSLNLPIMIDATQRTSFVTASTEAKVAAVYALVEGTTYYGIKGNASSAAVKALWDDAVAAGLLASQIVLSANQINIAGKTIYTSSKTDTVATSAADTAAVSKRNDIAQAMGYLDWAAMASAATQGKTIIDGGYLRTSLIEVEDLLAQNITLDAAGYIESSNYAEDTSGLPTAGFKLDAANNKIKSYDMQANGGTFYNISLINGKVNGEFAAEKGIFYTARRYIYDLLVSSDRADFFTFIKNNINYFSGGNRYYNTVGYLTLMIGNNYYFAPLYGVQIAWRNTTQIEIRLYTLISQKDGNLKGEETFIFNEENDTFTATGIYYANNFSFVGLTIVI